MVVVVVGSRSDFSYGLSHSSGVGWGCKGDRVDFEKWTDVAYSANKERAKRGVIRTLDVDRLQRRANWRGGGLEEGGPLAREGWR